MLEVMLIFDSKLDLNLVQTNDCVGWPAVHAACVMPANVSSWLLIFGNRVCRLLVVRTTVRL